MEGLEGQTLGQYILAAPIGRGGMATVYKAYQPSLDRYVAIKVLSGAYAASAAFRQRLLQEARAVARLRHPNILTVFDAGEAEGMPYIVMELLEGGTLEQRLGQPLPLDWTIAIASQVCAALEYAHGAGVVHRDVKPSNIMLTEDNRAVLTDFGIAKVLAEASRLTATGGPVGTPAYMSPEQALGGEVDARSDLYSLGVVLYEMLTGQPPFLGEPISAVVHAHAHQPVPPPRSRNPELSQEVEAVILKALAKDPRQRFQSAREMARALAAAGRLTITLPPEAPPWRRAYRRLRLSTLLLSVALLAAAALVASVLAFFLIFGRPWQASSPSAGRVSAASLTAEGNQLLQAGDLETAIAKYQQALQLDPQDDVARTQLGIAYYVDEQEALAAEQLRLATATNAQNAGAFAFWCGSLANMSLADASYLAKAEAACAQALTLDPGSAEAHGFLAEVYAHQGKLDEALAEADKAVALDSNSAFAQASLGYVREKRQEYDLAAEAYKRAAALQPNLMYLQVLAARALRWAGQLDESLAYLQSALRLDQGSRALIWALMGIVYWEKDDSEQAVASFQQSLALNKNTDQAHWGWGAVLYEQGKYEEALAHFQTAASLDPQEANYHAWLGATYMKLKRLDEARASLTRALELDPENEDAQYFLNLLSSEQADSDR